MVVYAYLRVSTDHQDVDNQRHGILEYANNQGLVPAKFISEEISGRTPWQKRSIGQLLRETAQSGDVVIFAEISRMARSTLQVLEILEYSLQRGITVHLAKQNLVIASDLQSRITATILGLAAEIEREFISLRTKEALAKRKAEGQSLGRPPGKPSAKLKLDNYELEIRSYLAKGISKRSIAKLIECSPSTLYHWLARKKIHPRQGGES